MTTARSRSSGASSTDPPIASRLSALRASGSCGTVQSSARSRNALIWSTRCSSSRTSANTSDGCSERTAAAPSGLLACCATTDSASGNWSTSRPCRFIAAAADAVARVASAELLPHDAVRLLTVEATLHARHYRAHHRPDGVRTRADRVTHELPHVRFAQLCRHVVVQQLGFLLFLCRQLLAAGGTDLLRCFASALD